MRYEKKDIEKLLEREKNLLLLFSEDERISYSVDQEGEEFFFDAKSKQLSIPFSFFQEHGMDETKLLYHLYLELALYPSYRKEPEYYENRISYFTREEETMMLCFLQRIKECHVENDPAFQKENVKYAVDSEILAFLNEVDFYISTLIVERKAPLYANPKVKKQMGEMILEEDLMTENLKKNKSHKNLGRGLLIQEFFSLEDIETLKIQKDFSSYIGAESKIDFYQENYISLLSSSPQERDRFTRAFLFPLFLSLYQNDLMNSLFSETRKEVDWDKTDSKKKNPFSSSQQKSKMIHSLKEEKETRTQEMQQVLLEDKDFSSYGVEKEDAALFDHYQNAVSAQRKEMKNFWRRLLGSAYKEEKRKVSGLLKGQLDVPSLISSYPSFVEAQQKNNYRNLPIYSLREDVKVSKKLPQSIDIYFAIDDSGSMRGEKLLYAREALTIVLLSLDDFTKYLKENNARTHQKTKVQEKTYLFGTSHRTVLDFNDRGKEKMAHIMLSVTSLKGEGGYTDDAKLFSDIGKELQSKETLECHQKRRIRLLFIITDGASSFPSVSKKALEDLREKEMHISAIGIASKEDDQAKNVFQSLYGKDGVFLGKDIEKLPEQLLSLLKKRMKDIFQNQN